MARQRGTPYREHKEGSAEYSGVKSIPVPEGNGYPNPAPKTQTVKTRGTGAATQGTKSSSRLG